MAPTITPLDATLGATITGVDLAQLDDDTWGQIEDAFNQYALLVFPGQNLTDAEQTAFARRFGEIEQLVPGEDMPSVPLSNQNEDGSVLKSDEPFFKILRGNENWHTDSSYMPLAAKASVLSAQVVPPSGGETEWADMRAAWDALDEDRKAQVTPLAAYHSLYYSQAEAGFVFETGAGYGYHTKGAPLRGLIKEHPVTGRTALFIGRHAYGIPGLEEAASKQLLTELVEFACQAPRTYKHAWQIGDVLLWDNRCLLHRACPYDTTQARVVRHTRISGDPATELASTSAADEFATEYKPATSNY